MSESMLLYCPPAPPRRESLFGRRLCENGNAELMDLTAVKANITETATAELPVIGSSTYTKTISSPLVKAGYDTMSTGIPYGWRLIGYWAS
ncbi:hypothetical protein ASPZODRAFT_26064 [Penicilliopsis zonata CBS 506.65]|uniref:Uncharacterized protein n=1 Tax=Penicilliopsis zonata CBS 506.65 TaxID=1073090 RepID=A0A1L9SG89_9EURO|nr:hypothetical protein ASPZODRAFT_26064 [Penicilliopsis zonata CBS 506.65]OJJ46182.1 hypothetical protein ASPZODRAFT_26064 [Penicilliopsis zonata CBS 506.65]